MNIRLIFTKLSHKVTCFDLITVSIFDGRPGLRHLTGRQSRIVLGIYVFHPADMI